MDVGVFAQLRFAKFGMFESESNKQWSVVLREVPARSDGLAVSQPIEGSPLDTRQERLLERRTAQAGHHGLCQVQRRGRRELRVYRWAILEVGRHSALQKVEECPREK